MEKTTRILLISAAILAVGLIACGCVRNRKEDEIDFSPIENQQSSSSELNSSDSSESSSSSEENSSVPTESTSSSSEESSVPDSKPVDEPPVSSSSSSSSSSDAGYKQPSSPHIPASSSSTSSSSSSALAPGYNIYGEKSKGKWVEMPGGTFWEEEDGFYYSYEDWVNCKSPVPDSIVLGENLDEYDGPDINWR